MKIRRSSKRKWKKQKEENKKLYATFARKTIKTLLLGKQQP